MRIFAPSKPSLPGHCRVLMIIQFYTLFFLSQTSGNTFQVNDEVKLTRDAPLVFVDKPYRQGTVGETFKVLAHRADQKKVFLATKDPSGKQIAISVDEDAVSLLPADKVKLQADVLAAVSRQQYAAAKNLLDQALRASPDDIELRSTGTALEAVFRNAQQLKQTSANQKSMMNDLQRRRRNADVTDRVNPLNANDDSGRQRAEQVRGEANRLEAQAKESLRTAENDYDAALSALKAMMQGQESKSASTKVGDSVGPKPGLPMTAEQSKQFKQAQEQSMEEGKRQRQAAKDEIKEWTEDEAVRPVGIPASSPTYEETIDFINSKIIGHQQKIWFGKRHQKLIYRHLDQLTILDPKVLTPTVKSFVSTNESGQRFTVQLETTGGRNEIEYLRQLGSESRFGRSLTLYCNDELDAQKVAKACRHLIIMFGGESEPF